MSLCHREQWEHSRENEGRNQEDSDAYDVGSLGIECNCQMVKQPDRDNEHQEDYYSDNKSHKGIDPLSAKVANIRIGSLCRSFLIESR